MKKVILAITLAVVLLISAISQALANGPLLVEIDIKPGSNPNPLNVKSKGVLPVGVLGSEDFDVMTVDPTELVLTYPHGGIIPAPIEPLRWSWEDVNEDGYIDIISFYKMQEVMTLTVTYEPDRAGILLQIQGKLKEEFGGTPIYGEDVVVIIKNIKE